MKRIMKTGGAVLCATVLVALGACQRPREATPPGAVVDATESTTAPATATPGVAWETFPVHGEPSGVGAKGAATAPQKRPLYPYQDLTATLFVMGCDDAWVRFSARPHLAGGARSDTHNIKARSNGEDVTETMGITWEGTELVWLASDAAVIAAWAAGHSYELRVPLSVGTTRWVFDMSGAAAAIGETCPALKPTEREA